MAAASVPNDQRLELPFNSTPKVAGRERRELERAITSWEQEAILLGRQPTLMTLDPDEIIGEKWSYRFIVAAVDPLVENWTLLFYGDKFAALLGLPAKPNQSIPMIQQLPPRFVPVFTKGCTAANSLGVPVRMQGAVEREDGRRELYRAVFIGFRVKPNGSLPLAFGSLNYRVTDRSAPTMRAR
jgi:hypothetical protein